MAQQPKLKVDGTELPNVLEVSYAFVTSVDRDGRPTMGVACEGITIRRIADGKTTLANWAKAPKKDNRKNGEIDFYSNDDIKKAMKTLSWKNGYLTDYSVTYVPDADHVEERVVIQAEEITSGGLTANFNWAGK